MERVIALWLVVMNLFSWAAIVNYSVQRAGQTLSEQILGQHVGQDLLRQR